MTTPAEMKKLGIRHLQSVLDRTADPVQKAKIERFIVEERAKPDSAYPVSTDKPR